MTFKKGNHPITEFKKGHGMNKGNKNPMYGKIPWNKGIKINRTKFPKMGHFKKHSEATKKRLKEINNGKLPWNTGLKLLKNEYPKMGWRTSRKNQIFPLKDSSIEIKIQNFLTNLHIEFFTHKYMSEITHSYQCDIFIPKQETEGIIIPKKIIIECDGCYWHGCNICNKDVNKWQNEQIKKDKVRTKELTEKGFRIIRIWEHDIKKMELNEFKRELEC